MIEVSDKTRFLKLTPVYIILSLLLIVVSLVQRAAGLGDYTGTILYFSVPAVIVGVLFQMYPIVQGISPRFEGIAYVHLSLFLISLLLYAAGRGFGLPYLLSSLTFLLYLILNTRKLNGQVQLFLAVGSLFYMYASFLIFVGTDNIFLIKHSLAVGFLLTVAFGSIYMLLPMLQLERLAFSEYLWIHLALHTFFVADFLISWSRLDFKHVYVSGLLILSSTLFHCFAVFRTLSGRSGPLRGLDPSVKAFALSLFILVPSLVVGVLSAGAHDFSLVRAHSDGLLYGFFPILTLGASYHIVPFMLWWRRYATLMDSGKVPTLKELFPERFMERSILILTVSLLGMVASERDTLLFLR